jgi:outer membrane protein assembly factor BamD
MNRWLVRTSAFGLAAVLAFSPCAFAVKHKPKKKKNADLSANPLANVNSQQPDKLLFDKAALAMKKGKFDVARLDLQTLLNTYSDSEFAMRAKLMIGDTWFKEGGSAALAQAESEYKDFITFFPNTPEAAEAQMKVGDIYFQQMEKPDRDPQNAENAEREYRTMLEQFPDSPLIPRAKQKLREVQEVLAQRQFEIGEFYAAKEDWAASIARLQTVADTYPLFSHSDQTLITIGDAYATQAQMISRARNMPPKAKAEIVKYYNDRAVSAWDRVVTRYPLAPHVEDAKDRLIAMGVPVPEPSTQALAESQAEEDSRVPVKIGKRALDLLSRGPDTVHAARVGEPSENSPTPIVAPDVVKQSQTVYTAALKGEPLPNGPMPGQAPATNEAIANGTAPPTTDQPATPLTFQNVQEGGGSTGNQVTVQVEAPSSSGGEANGTTGGTEAPAANAATSGEGTQPAAAAPLVAPVGPTNDKPLPAVDKPAEAPQQINEVQGGSQAQVQTGATTNGKQEKKKKAPYDKKDESSSKHKKKTGLDKLNPF